MANQIIKVSRQDWIKLSRLVQAQQPYGKMSHSWHVWKT